MKYRGDIESGPEVLLGLIMLTKGVLIARLDQWNLGNYGQDLIQASDINEALCRVNFRGNGWSYCCKAIIHILSFDHIIKDNVVFINPEWANQRLHLFIG